MLNGFWWLHWILQSSLGSSVHASLWFCWAPAESPWLSSCVGHASSKWRSHYRSSLSPSACPLVHTDHWCMLAPWATCVANSGDVLRGDSHQGCQLRWQKCQNHNAGSYGATPWTAQLFGRCLVRKSWYIQYMNEYTNLYIIYIYIWYIYMIYIYIFILYYM